MTQRDDVTATDAIGPSDMISRIVSAYANRPDVGIDDIVRLTKELTQTLGVETAGTPRPEMTEHSDPEGKVAKIRTPAVPIEQAVRDEAVTCLVCGKSFKTLKRHLMAAHGMSEGQYRAAFGLSDDFPIVAPSYSERRSQVASDTGFGTYDRGSREAGEIA